MTTRAPPYLRAVESGWLRCLMVVCCVQPLHSLAQRGAALDDILFDPQPLLALEPQPLLVLEPEPLAQQRPVQNAGAAPAPSTSLSSSAVPFSSNPGNRAVGDGIPPAYLLPLQPDLEATSAERYLDAIADEELSNGPFAPELLQQYAALGETYQQRGDHEAALEAFGKAEYISRINNGLYAPDQFAIVENIIESHVATGDLPEANRSQQYLLFLQQQYYGEDSMEVVPALVSIGDWNMEAFNTILGRPGSYRLALNPARQRAAFGEDNPRMLAFGNLYRAQDNYYQAILNMTRHRGTGNPLLMDLERKLVEAIFLGANRTGIMEDPGFYIDQRRSHTGSRISRSILNASSMSFINGRNAFIRMRIYQESAAAADPLAVAATIIGLGDWHMLFHRRQTALDYYQEAQAYLQERQVSPDVIESLLDPPVPVQLPLFTPLPHSREHFRIAPDVPLEYDGHIDVRFRITRFGNVRDVEVLDRSGLVTPELERRLKRLLRSAPFRPRMPGGISAQNETVALRYHFAAVE